MGQRGGHSTHASYDLQQLARVTFGQTAARIHLVDVERDCAGAQLLDEQVRNKVVVVGQVAHVHNLRGPPDEDRAGSGGDI